MELKKYKLGDIAKIEISGVDKKSVDGETPVRLCNFVGSVVILGGLTFVNFSLCIHLC